ncbi:MAG: FAD-dependent oxidoreductase [Planctomycetes bacterium]|nr:FAD-dependent oxidoreductase [Planctomycetota bacterium]
MSPSPIRIDALVVGGGVAGLFTLDALTRAGRNALLLERHALGTGQTTSSQGILHAGVKYALGGSAGEDAREASMASAMWQSMLTGKGQPDLASLRTLASHEFLWRSSGLRGVAGMLGARLALQTRPEAVAAAERPGWLQGVRGDVFRLGEVIIDPRDLLDRLARPHAARLAQGEVVGLRSEGSQASIEALLGGQRVQILASQVFLTAGEGNEALLAMAGLASEQPMQRRPLRQAMVRGNLPWVFGHCIDGARTRVTITSDEMPGGVVWHVGGELAERGPSLAEGPFLLEARSELVACLPGVDLRAAEFSSYLVQRAEPRTGNGRRPASVHVQRDGPFVTVWPVKLVMAPRAAEQAAALSVAAHPSADGQWPAASPRPGLARRPWEEATWTHPA